MRSLIPINIISPHHDDAAFSLALTIHELSRMSYSINVINAYTVSKYFPHKAADKTEIVSLLRAKEDLAFLSGFSSVKQIDLGRLDAPLRLCSDQVRDGHEFTSDDHKEVDALCENIQAICVVGAFLLPLSLGNHIDHRITLKAGLMASGQAPIGLFEDLPYAAEYGEEEIQEVVDRVQRVLKCQFHPIVVRTASFLRLKRRYLKQYPSQAGPTEINAILSHARRYDGGERIWLDDSIYAELSCKF